MYSRITAAQASRIGGLEHSLGSNTLRTILTGENQRLMRPERLRNLLAGSGKLTEQEANRLQIASTNRNQLVALQKRGKSKQKFRTNRALRDWVLNGTQKGQGFANDSQGRDDQMKAIRALRYLGIDVSDGTFYVNQRKG